MTSSFLLLTTVFSCLLFKRASAYMSQAFPHTLGKSLGVKLQVLHLEGSGANHIAMSLSCHPPSVFLFVPSFLGVPVFLCEVSG